MRDKYSDALLVSAFVAFTALLFANLLIARQVWQRTPTGALSHFILFWLLLSFSAGLISRISDLNERTKSVLRSICVISAIFASINYFAPIGGL